MTRTIQPSNQDFNLVKISTEKCTNEFGQIYNFTENSIAFQFLVLGKLFNLQEDEIVDAITDTIFLQKFIGGNSGPDRGIDAIKIDHDENEVHLFNFKYNEIDIERVRDKNFPGSEVNNIIVFVKDLFEKNKTGFLNNSSNSKLKDKVNEIWENQDAGERFKFKIHLASNIFKGLNEDEHQRLNSELNDYRGEVSFDYVLVSDIVDSLIDRQKLIHGKFKALSDHYFDKIDAGNRALILEISARDLLRITSDNENLRLELDVEDEQILTSEIEEMVFDDNVRVYLKQRTNINKNIKETALNDEESAKIFFYNNGITVTCDKLDYQGRRNQTISLTNFQIVNGGQTVHALRSAFEENQENFDQITLLCKIYETIDIEFKSRIAEYTNSQNPVRDRDIRSIDLVQIKLGQELHQLGYFYERKRNQFEAESRLLRIDSEKLGQAFLAFSFGMPAEAKNKKGIIFGAKYDDIFSDNLTGDDALKVYKLYKEIEQKKIDNRNTKPYLLHSTYYIMFFISKLRGDQSEDSLIGLYDNALEKIEYIIDKEKARMGESYLDAVLFKSNRPKDYLTELGL